MSGLISSLLIEPVVRQARRLSFQANSQPPHNDHQVESRRDRTSSIGDNDDEDIATADREEEGNNLRTGLEDSLPASSPIDLAPRRHATETLEPMGFRSNNMSSQNLDEHSELMHGSLVSTATAIAESEAGAVAFVATHGTSPSTQDIEGHPNDSFDMEDIGGQILLPEDDGMGVLRRKIHAIRDLRASNEEKAHMIHDLMTESYNASRGLDYNHFSQMATSPSSPLSLERSVTPASRWSGQSFDRRSATPTSTDSMGYPYGNPYNLTAEDLKPTFFPKPELDPTVCDVEDGDAEEIEESLGCRHYKRNVKLQCFACKKWYTCRFCHDEVEDHHLDRPKTENMLCMLCGHAQPAAQACRQCDEQAAQYYCNICKLWDNGSSKSIYHCNDCGICRIGQGLGKDFFHCKTCSVCLPISIENTHRCIERSTQCDCPICGDYMFTSPETVVFMRCGHSIHQKCLSEYSKSSYRCPICNKSIANMEATFRNLDRTIQSQPMPAEFKDTNALIYCNDCGVKSVVQYHWLGLKCDMCESYNTAQLRLLHGEVIESLEQDGEGMRIQTTRMRSSSHNADEAMTSTLASLQIDSGSLTGTSPNSRLVEPNGRFASYSLTRDRAVSPVISNYFGLPTERPAERSSSEKPRSMSFFESIAGKAIESDADGEIRLWGRKITYKYGFLSRATESGEGASEGEDEGVDDEEFEDDHSEKAEEVYEEDDDDDDQIDIFGHR